MQDRTPPTPPADASESGSFVRAAAAREAAWPVASWRDLNVAVAVSGGADSVALLRMIVAAKAQAGGRGSVAAIHFDHRVRGDSAADAAFVERLASELGVSFLGGASESSGPRAEESLRDERRAFYDQSAKALGAREVATAHTADDQAETLLFRLLRGAGPRGLAGIRPRTRLNEACSLVRPLLAVGRDEIERCLAELGQPWRDDPTNQDEAYTRNWVRHRVTPLLCQRFPDAIAKLAAAADRIAETSDLLDSLAEALLDAARRPAPSPDTIGLDVATLAASSPALVLACLRLAWRRAGWPEQAMTAAHWRQLAEEARSETDAAVRIFPGDIRVERSEGRVLLARQRGGSCETVSC